MRVVVIFCYFQIYKYFLNNANLHPKKDIKINILVFKDVIPFLFFYQMSIRSYNNHLSFTFSQKNKPFFSTFIKKEDILF